MNETINERPAAWIRLACLYCDREDKDGITPEDLLKCMEDGWIDISMLQTYERSIAVYDDPEDAPVGYNVLDWYTHLGRCPNCEDTSN